MRFRLPNASSQCVSAYPMCLRNASSPIQCVFAMRLRHPMRLRSASAPPNASVASQCVCAFQCVFTQLQNASAPANASSPIRPVFDECIFAMRMRLQVVCHTPPGRRNAYIYIYTYLFIYFYLFIYLYLFICLFICIYIYGTPQNSKRYKYRYRYRYSTKD